MEMLSLRQEVFKKGKITFIFILCTYKSLNVDFVTISKT